MVLLDYLGLSSPPPLPSPCGIPPPLRMHITDTKVQAAALHHKVTKRTNVISERQPRNFATVSKYWGSPVYVGMFTNRKSFSNSSNGNLFDNFRVDFSRANECVTRITRPCPLRLLACLLDARLQLLIDLVNHSSSVLPFESRKEIRLLTPSHDGRLLVVLDVDGRALLVNLQRRVVLHRFNFKKKVHGVGRVYSMVFNFKKGYTICGTCRKCGVQLEEKGTQYRVQGMWYMVLGKTVRGTRLALLQTPEKGTRYTTYGTYMEHGIWHTVHVSPDLTPAERPPGVHSCRPLVQRKHKQHRPQHHQHQHQHHLTPAPPPEKTLPAIAGRAVWEKITKGRAGIRWDNVLEEREELRRDQENALSIEKFGGY